ncbi:MAG: helix-turn-helix transcriptional regulator [Clostridia bacterium]|nr:helix-turn-helix transcriptional regulator [Clostridia bacterium]
MNRIEELRNARRMTQFEFADFCAISRSSIARYEAGGKISRSNAEAIAAACGTTIDYVLGLDAPQTENRADQRQSDLREAGAGQRELLELYFSLNEEGRERLIEQARDMAQLPRWTRIREATAG